VFWQAGYQIIADRFGDVGAVLTLLFAKWNLPPARLLATAFIFVLFFNLVHNLWRPLHAALGSIVIPLGSSALVAYCAHLLVITLFTWQRGAVLSGPTANPFLGTVISVSAVLMVWLLVRIWSGARKSAAWAFGEPAARRSFNPVAATLGAAVLTFGIVSAPVAAPPIGGFVAMRDDRSTFVEPHYSLYIPPSAPEYAMLPILVVLHDLNEEAEEFGAPLLGMAQRDGWLLVAPRLDYHADFRDPSVVAAESPRILTGVRDVVSELATNTGLRLRRRVALIGSGRGAPLAQRYAMIYPGEVRAVALFGGGGYTAPPRDGPIPDADFPIGIRGLSERFGRTVTRDGLGSVPYWIGVGSNDVRTEDTSRAWDAEFGVTRVDRAAALTRYLRAAGAEVSFSQFDGVDHAMTDSVREGIADFMTRFRGGPLVLPPLVPPATRQ
jgi:pimeloyl-ACP methyl ester carboxylesterase